MHQNALFELLNVATGIDAELLREGLSKPLARAQSVGLPSEPVLRQHELAEQALPHGMECRQLPQLRHHLGVPSTGQVGLDPILEGIQPQVLQPSCFDRGEWVISYIGERLAPPETQRITEEARSTIRLLSKDTPGLIDEPLEPHRVDLFGIELKHIAALPRSKDLLVSLIAEDVAYLRDVIANGLDTAPRATARPEFREDPVGGQDTAGMEQEQN